MNKLLSKSDINKGRDLWHKLVGDLIPTRITRISVSEWAEDKRVIPQGLSPYPGAFRWTITPYLREIADNLSETNPVHKIAVMKGAQLGFTVGLGENWVGYVIDAAPGPFLYITGDASMAQSQMSRRIDAMIYNAGLNDRIFAQNAGKKSRKSGDTQVEKQFAGGFLRAIGPNSASKLRQDSIQYLYGDEVDAYPESSGREGDPVYLAEKRTAAFVGNRKILYTSTPLYEHDSRIKELFEAGDQRYYYVPCKHCGEMQVLKWENFIYEIEETETGRKYLDWDSVRYVCPHCGQPHKNEDKTYMLPRGEWRATERSTEPGYVSYHLSALYAPVEMFRWEQAVQDYLAADDEVKMQVWENTVLGKPYELQGERPSIEILVTRERGYHTNTLPQGAYEKAIFVTIGADVQKDRIECEIVAWGKDAESWSVDYRVFYGDTKDLGGNAWQGLKKTIEQEHVGLPTILTAIDAGYIPEIVYEFVDKFESGVHPVMGSEDIERGRRYIRVRYRDDGTARIELNTDLLKQRVYHYLSRTPNDDGSLPLGFCHFPEEYTREHFNRLTAEHRVLRKYGNREKYEWQSGQRRNEQLDCRVYALAMVHAYKHYVATEHEIEPSELQWEDFWEYAKQHLKGE